MGGSGEEREREWGIVGKNGRERVGSKPSEYHVTIAVTNLSCFLALGEHDNVL